MSSVALCLNTWSSGGGAVWGSCRTFRRCSLAGQRGLQEDSMEGNSLTVSSTKCSLVWGDWGIPAAGSHHCVLHQGGLHLVSHEPEWLLSPLNCCHAFHHTSQWLKRGEMWLICSPWERLDDVNWKIRELRVWPFNLRCQQQSHRGKHSMNNFFLQLHRTPAFLIHHLISNGHLVSFPQGELSSQHSGA